MTGDILTAGSDQLREGVLLLDAAAGDRAASAPQTLAARFLREGDGRSGPETALRGAADRPGSWEAGRSTVRSQWSRSRIPPPFHFESRAETSGTAEAPPTGPAPGWPDGRRSTLDVVGHRLRVVLLRAFGQNVWRLAVIV